MRQQRSISQMVTCSGVGLHSGQRVTLNFLPAPVNTGIVFIRRDIDPSVFIKAHVQNVVETDLSTTLGVGQHLVRTVEHLLAAVTGLGIDNLYVELNASEVPILDGSAASFVNVLKEAGIVSQGIGQPYIKIVRTVEIREGSKRIRIEPSPSLRIRCSIAYDHPLIGEQTFLYEHGEEMFCNEIASARTYCFLQEIQALWERGVAQGGSLENAIVIGEEGILNEMGLRYKNEFARHKVLDLLGDLTLIGLPVVGKVIAERAGHALHTRFVAKILAEEKAWKIVEEGDREAVVGKRDKGLLLPVVEKLAPGRFTL